MAINNNKIQKNQIRTLPTPVNNGIYEMTMKAFEQGMPNMNCPVILRGTLLKMTDGGKLYRIKSRGFEGWIRWYMDTIPPEITINSRITVIGDLLSANAGNKIMVVDCIPVKNHTDFMDDLKSCILRNVMNINDYCEKPKNDLHFIKARE